MTDQQRKHFLQAVRLHQYDFRIPGCTALLQEATRMGWVVVFTPFTAAGQERTFPVKLTPAGETMLQAFDR